MTFVSMADSAYQLYTISEGGALCRHVSDVTPAHHTFRSREAWVGSGGSKGRSSSRTFSTVPDRFGRLDTHASGTNSSSSATLQYNSLTKQNGGPNIEKGELPPAIRTQALVQIPTTRSQTNQKRGTRSLPNSSLQDAVEPLPRHATSATGRKDPGIAKQTTSGVKVPFPKINNLVKGEFTSVTHNQDHGYRMPAPAGVPTTRNAVLLAGDKPPRHTPLVTPLPEWLQEPRQEHRAAEKNKNELNRSSRTDHPKPWLQVVPKKSQDTGTGNKRNGAPPRIGIFHAPEMHQKTFSDLQEEERRKPEAKAKDRSYKSPERSQTGKTSKEWEKKEGRKESPGRQKEPHRTFGTQPRTRVKKAARARKRPDYKPETGSSTETDDSSSSEDDGLFSFVKRKPAQDVTSSPRRGDGKKGAPETDKTTGDGKKRYTIQDAVSVYKREYVRVKGKHRSLADAGGSRRRHQVVGTQASPRSRSRERILTRREATIYQNMSKAYATDEVQRRREDEFYKRLLELQMKKWHEEYRQHMKQQLRRLDKQQQQETQLMRVRRKFFEEQLKRWRSQYITGRVVTHEWANRSDYGLPEDDYTGSKAQEDKLFRKLKPKKFSFKKQYLRNKKKYDTIFKRRALFVNHGLKPPKMEGIDTVELDGSGSRDVKDVLKEAENLLDQTSEDSDDISSSEDDAVGQSSDDNVHGPATSYRTTRPLPRRERDVPEKKKKRVVVVPPPKRPAAEWKRKQPPAKAKAERATGSNTGPPRTERGRGDAASSGKTRPIQGPAPRYQSQFADWKTLPLDDDSDDSGEETSTEVEPKLKPTPRLDDSDEDGTEEEDSAQKTEAEPKAKAKPSLTLDDADEGEPGKQPTRQKAGARRREPEGDSRKTSSGAEAEGTDQRKVGESPSSQQPEDGERLKGIDDEQKDASPLTGDVIVARADDDDAIADEKRPEADSKNQPKVSGSPDVRKTSPSADEKEVDGKGKAVHDNEKNANSGSDEMKSGKGRLPDGESGSREPHLVKVDSEERGNGTKDDVSGAENDNANSDPDRRTSETTSDAKDEGDSGIKVDPVRIDPDKSQSPLKDTRTHGNKEGLAIPADKGNKQTKPLKSSAQKEPGEKKKPLPKDEGFGSTGKLAEEPESEKSGEPSSKVTGAKEATAAPSKDPPTPGAKQTKAGKTNDVRPEQTGDKTAQNAELPAKYTAAKDGKTGKTDSLPPRQAEAKGTKRDTAGSLPTKTSNGKQGRTGEGDDVHRKPVFEQSQAGITGNVPPKSTEITPAKSGHKGDVPKAKSGGVKPDKTDAPKSDLADGDKRSGDIPRKSPGATQEKHLPNGDLLPKRARDTQGKGGQSAGADDGKQPTKGNQRNEKDIGSVQNPTKPTDSKKPKTHAGDEPNRNTRANDSRHPKTDNKAQKPETKRSKSDETTQPKESAGSNLNKRPEQKATKQTKEDKKSKTKPKHDNDLAKINRGKPRSPRPATRQGPGAARKSTPSKRGKQKKDKAATKDGTTGRKRTPRSGKKDDDQDFNLSSYLEDRKRPNVYVVRLSDDDSTDSDEDIFEKAMRKYGIRVDDSD